MSGITLKNIHKAGGVLIPPPPIQDFWSIDDELVVCVGDLVGDHGKYPHRGAKMATGSSWFTLDGNPVCSSGDKATCNHVANGLDWWMID